MKMTNPVPPANADCRAEAQHPKLADAETLERCARLLERQNEDLASATDRLAICYAFLNQGEHRLAREHQYLPPVAMDINTRYLERRARELREEVAKENMAAAPKELNYPGRALAPDPANEFLAEMKQLAKDVEVSADSALAAKDSGTRKAFVFTTFNRLLALQNRLAGLDLRGPA